MRRGDIILVEFPFSDGSDAKRRPVLVVQSDRIKLRDLVIAGISGTESETSVRLEPASAPVKKICYVRCEKLYTVARTTTYGAVGSLPMKQLLEITDCLRKVLDL